MTKKKDKGKEPIRIYIEYERSEHGGEKTDPNERWSSREDAHVDVKFIRLHRQPPKDRFFYDSIEIRNEKLLKLDKLFLAVVRYGTGDSFGRTKGEYYIAGIAPTYKIAQAILAEETKPSEKGDYSNYKPWEGYFNSLEETEIHELSLV